MRSPCLKFHFPPGRLLLSYQPTWNLLFHHFQSFRFLGGNKLSGNEQRSVARD